MPGVLKFPGLVVGEGFEILVSCPTLKLVNVNKRPCKEQEPVAAEDGGYAKEMELLLL